MLLDLSGEKFTREPHIPNNTQLGLLRAPALTHAQRLILSGL